MMSKAQAEARTREVKEAFAQAWALYAKAGEDGVAAALGVSQDQWMDDVQHDAAWFTAIPEGGQ